ncbi:hypothetical protein [Robertmurraya sp. P23]|uniref:hypothetical protein n=1 Tax=Robertmurraya sp. P23 TaxID=3436931 RepID=UPI003D971665
MSFSENTRISDLLKSEAAKAVLEKYFPGFTTANSLDRAQGFTLKVISKFPQSNMTSDQVKACVEELAKIDEPGIETITIRKDQLQKKWF